MGTLVAFVAAIAAAVGLSLALSRSLTLRRSAGTAVAWVVAPVSGVVHAAARAADTIIGPTIPRAAPLRLVSWAALNFLPLLAVLAFWSLFPEVAGQLPLYADPGVLLGLLALFQALVLAAAVVGLHARHDGMVGLSAWAPAPAASGALATPSCIAIAAFLFVACVAASLYWLQDIRALGVMVHGPGTGNAVADVVLATLWAMPTEIVLRPLDWLFGHDTQPVFDPGLLGTAFHAVVYLAGLALVAGFASAGAETLLQGRRLIAGLGQVRDFDRQQMVIRARAAPPTIRRGIVDAAISTSDPEVRRRLFEAARDAEILALPEVVLGHLESFDESTQLFAVDRALELFRQRSQEFDKASCEAMVQSGVRLIARGRLSSESGKRVTRLLVAVLTACREVIALDDATRDRLTEHVNAAIVRSRGDGDAAYRGLLQDLRAAIARAAASRLPTTVSMPVGRGALPGSQPPKARR